MTLNKLFDKLVEIQIAEEISINQINGDCPYEEIELNSKPQKPEIKSETNIDWNFVLGLFFGIGYLIFA